MVMAMVVLMGGMVSGTIAWLISESPTLVNTFTYGDIDIGLSETPTVDGDDDPNTNEYVMIPGKAIAKDPKVTVYAGSETTWLFVKLEESANFADFMTYEIADGWTALTGAPGVYYRKVDKSDVNVEFYVLKDNQVQVKESVTREMLAALETGTKPQLSVTAYAVQYDETIETISKPETAWALVQTENSQITP